MADAEFELMTDRAGGDERGAVGAVLRLRTDGDGAQVAPMPRPVARRRQVAIGRKRVDAAREGRAAGAIVGDELEASLNLRVETGHIEIRSDDLGVLDLPQRRIGETPGAVLIRVVLIPPRL